MSAAALALAALLGSLGTFITAVASLVGVLKARQKVGEVAGKVEQTNQLVAGVHDQATDAAAAAHEAKALAADTNDKVTDTAAAVEQVKAIVINGGTSSASSPATGAPASSAAGAGH